jgi:hypothetical protein
MDIVARFEHDVRASFAVLEREFELTFDGISPHLPEIAAQFRSRTTKITILYEIGSPPWVELTSLLIHGSPTFSLELLLEERAPDDMGYTCDPAEPGSAAFRSCLDFKAAALRTVAGDVLRGDFTVLPRMEIRLRENEARRTKDVFGALDENPEEEG